MNRRKFLRRGGSAAALAAVSPLLLARSQKPATSDVMLLTSEEQVNAHDANSALKDMDEAIMFYVKRRFMIE